MGINTLGFRTLFKKESLRFLKVWFQTLLAPVITALLYQMIFTQVMKGRADILPSVAYTAFLIPGLAAMSMLQNAFANVSSSLIQSRISGNLVFVLLSPISPLVFYAAYVGAAIVRGMMVGLGVILATCWFGLPIPYNILWIVVFALLGCAVMGSFGLLAGIVAEKYEQMAMFQNFIIMPLTFLSGVFYSIKSLPTFWQGLSYFNPIFYMIDGFRYGFFGVSDVSPYLSLSVILVFLIGLSISIYLMLKSGYKLRD